VSNQANHMFHIVSYCKILLKKKQSGATAQIPNSCIRHHSDRHHSKLSIGHPVGWLSKV